MDLIAKAERIFSGYNARDFAAMREVLHDDLEMLHFTRDFVCHGADRLVRLMESFSDELMPDRGFEPTLRISQAGNLVFREGYWGGTMGADVPGFGAKGETLRLRLCSVLRFADNGRVIAWWDYG